MKVFPVTAAFDGDLHAPSLTYELWSRRAGKGRLRLFTSPANPLVYGGELRVGVSCNAGEIQKLVLTDSRYKGGDNDCAAWERAVLNQEHVAEMEISLQEGLNRITVYAGDCAGKACGAGRRCGNGGQLSGDRKVIMEKFHIYIS